ncbi:MAG: Putative ABC transporter, periplasmic substrate-binding protein [Synergistales bacterium 58_81]|jgi:glycine betaine/proline transport system substrate-binding protein|nr:MAG: Putative ABC transporter, periplasmic substrate-binding protein [Synergistales bacterium 57_84]KUK85552.1 MAG: Putative ABC transporter, periplasmic substrate-binding protein [Synergistales bacterium 58_81]HCP07002.1 ABC transporter substrate-binding protein [Synergistaceae bacterium]
MKAGRKTLLALALAVVVGLASIPTASAAGNVVMVDFSWSSVQMHNRIAGFILEHGYGYTPDYMFAESVPGLTGLQQGDIDIAMEMWIDNVLEWYDEAVEKNKQVIDLGPVFPDAPQGWYVPTYIIKGDKERGIEPVAPDLKSVFELPKYWELFKDPEVPNKGRFYNAIPGWVVHDINLKKLEAYNLTDTFINFDPGSQTALMTAIVSAYEKGEPVLAYYWEPEWIMGMLDMTMLEEPPYDPERWGEGKDYGCAFPAARVHIGVNAEFAGKNRQVVEFLKKYETTLAHNNEALAYMQQEEASVEDAAIWFLKNHKDVWKAWLPGDVAGKVEAALAGK